MHFAKWRTGLRAQPITDRKSTRLNSSHVEISYAVFCLKKKKKIIDKLTHLGDNHLHRNKGSRQAPAYAGPLNPRRISHEHISTTTSHATRRLSVQIHQ